MSSARSITLLQDQIFGLCIPAPRDLEPVLREYLFKLKQESFHCDDEIKAKRAHRTDCLTFMVRTKLRTQLQRWLTKQGYEVSHQAVMGDSPYRPPVDQLLELNEPDYDAKDDYSAMGISMDDESELIRMASDPEFDQAMEWNASVWAPVHAWRALCAMNSTRAIQPLLSLLSRIDEHDDDWIADDLTECLGRLGSPVIEPAAEFLMDRAMPKFARISAAGILEFAGESRDDLRDVCVGALQRQFERYAEEEPDFNGFVLAELLDLRAVELKDLMEKAFALGHVDESIVGDWEDVQIQLGLKTKRDHPGKYNRFSPLGRPEPFRESDEGFNQPIVNLAPKIGRNDPCPCGSGKKYKKCCGGSQG